MVPRQYADRFLAEYGRAESFGQMFDIITSTWWDSLQPSSTPTVLLWGANDRVLGPDQLADYRSLLPEHHVDVVTGWGHFPMATDPPTYTARVLDWAVRLSGPAEARQFVVLGSGVAADHSIAPKAALLDQALQSGLPVPPGIIIPDGCEIADVPPWVGKSLAVRSAFGSEDGEAQSMAGHFATLLRVPPGEARTAVAKVRASANPNAEVRRDVLIMQMVEATISGVAFSEPGYADDLIESTPGTAENLVAGQEPGRTEHLSRLLPGEAGTASGWRGRLARLLCSVRQEFGDSGWDIEWADDGERSYLIQIRPITVPLRRDDWFTMANHREILPDPPSIFMTSVLAEGSAELLDYYRRFDRSISDERLFIEVFDHRPMINLSLMTDFVRSLGLPTRLVTDSIGGAAEADHGLRLSRSLRRLPVLIRLAWGQALATRYANGRLAEMQRMTARDAATLREAVDRARRAFVATVHGMTALNTAAAAPTALLRATGTLEAHSARQETAATAMFRDLDVMRTMLTASDQVELRNGIAPTSHRLGLKWAEWLDEYGHRGAYESDLSRPRYVEDPTPILDSLASGHPFQRRSPRWTLRQILTLPLWAVARVPMSRREHFRSEAMRVFLRIRTDLLRLVSDYGVGEGELWLLRADEVQRLEEGWKPEQSLLDERERELREARNRPMPDLISRFSSHEDGTSPGTGIGLVAGVTTGRAWVIDEPSTRPPEALIGQPLVVVAPSVDAGWLPTFSLVDGIAVEMGGNLSHGSIILRELGLPAVTNAAGLRSRVRTGDRIRLDGATGSVELLD
jgi:pyruvate,water dikinase